MDHRLTVPEKDTLRGANDVERTDLPRFARVTRDRDLDSITDIDAAARRALDSLPLDSLPEGATVSITAGSRGIEDMPALLEHTVSHLEADGFDPR